MPAKNTKKARSNAEATARKRSGSQFDSPNLVFPVVIFTALSLVFAFIAFYKYAW